MISPMMISPSSLSHFDQCCPFIWSISSCPHLISAFSNDLPHDDISVQLHSQPCGLCSLNFISGGTGLLGLSDPELQPRDYYCSFSQLKSIPKFHPRSENRWIQMIINIGIDFIPGKSGWCGWRFQPRDCCTFFTTLLIPGKKIPNWACQVRKVRRKVSSQGNREWLRPFHCRGIILYFLLIPQIYEYVSY